MMNIRLSIVQYLIHRDECLDILVSVCFFTEQFGLSFFFCKSHKCLYCCVHKQTPHAHTRVHQESREREKKHGSFVLHFRNPFVSVFFIRFRTFNSSNKRCSFSSFYVYVLFAYERERERRRLYISLFVFYVSDSFVFPLLLLFLCL